VTGGHLRPGQSREELDAVPLTAYYWDEAGSDVVDGWDSFAAIETHLTEPTEDVIDSDFTSADTLNY
jgi:hypothetical protein